MSAILKPARARHRASDIGWFLDWLGDVQIVYMDGRVTDDSYERYLDAVITDIDGRADDDPISLLYHVPQPSALRTERRTRLAAVLKEREEALRRRTRAYAMVTPSLVVRSGLKVLFWLAPPPYPNAVAASPRDGFAFIARHHPGVEPDAFALQHEGLLARMRANE